MTILLQAPATERIFQELDCSMFTITDNSSSFRVTRGVGSKADVAIAVSLAREEIDLGTFRPVWRITATSSTKVSRLKSETRVVPESSVLVTLTVCVVAKLLILQ